MGQTTQQIESQIEDRREDLKANLQELETRVKSATDWRHQFQEHPGAMIAAAVGGGMLLSMMFGKRRSVAAAAVAPSRVSRPASGASRQALETWDTVKSALVGVTATKFKGVLGEVVPGFNEHLHEAESAHKRSSAFSDPGDRH